MCASVLIWHLLCQLAGTEEERGGRGGGGEGGGGGGVQEVFFKLKARHDVAAL